MPLPTIAIIGQTGMKCRKNRKDVKLRYTDDIYRICLKKKYLFIFYLNLPSCTAFS